MVVPALGGPERRIAQFHTGVALGELLASVCWAPDSRHLFVAASRSPGEDQQVIRLSVDSGDFKTLAALEAGAEGYTSLALSPDSSTLATVRVQGSRAIELIGITESLEASGSRVLEAAGGNVGQVRWTADSRDLIFSVGVNKPLPLPDRGALMFWAGPAPPIGVAPPVPHGVCRDAELNIWRTASVADAPESIAGLVFLPGGVSPILAGRPAAGLLLQPQRKRSDLDFGGRRLPLSAHLDGAAPARLARWSPDGQRISFDSTRRLLSRLRRNADGGQPRALTSEIQQLQRGVVARRAIYFSSTMPGETRFGEHQPAAGRQRNDPTETAPRIAGW
jgi:hypothetical protein